MSRTSRLPLLGSGVAVLGLLLASCSGSDGAGRHGGSTSAASCVAAVEFDGHTYLGQGELRRDPETTGRTVQGVIPGCNDTGGAEDEPDEDVELSELSDVPPETALLFHGTVFVREGSELPASTTSWFAAPECDEDGEFDLTGDWLGVDTPTRPRFDGDLQLPYRVEMHVTEGPDDYVGATVKVHAVESTSPVLSPDDVKSSLWTGGQVMARTTCDHGDFQAISLRVPPG